MVRLVPRGGGKSGDSNWWPSLHEIWSPANCTTPQDCKSILSCNKYRIYVKTWSFNSALLGKWLWRYGMKTDSLWRRVIEAKYGNIWGGQCTKKVTSPYGVSLWRFIGSGWLNFSKLLVYDVGDGTQVKFQKHVQCGDCTFQEVFLEHYCLSRSKGFLGG